MTSQDMSQDGRTPPDPEYVALYRRLRAEGGVELREQLHDRYLQLQRGGVTPGGLPWPAPTDPVAEGADAIRALAEAVEAYVRLVEVVPAASDGWALYRTQSSGSGIGVPYVAHTKQFALVRLVVRNTSGAAVALSGSATIATGLPNPLAGTSFYPLTAYSWSGSHAAGARADIAASVSSGGSLVLRSTGVSLAANDFVNVAGVYPTASQAAFSDLSDDELDGELA